MSLLIGFENKPLCMFIWKLILKINVVLAKTNERFIENSQHVFITFTNVFFKSKIIETFEIQNLFANDCKRSLIKENNFYKWRKCEAKWFSWQERHARWRVYLQLWGTGGTVVVHVSFNTVTRVRSRLRAVIWLKLPWSHVRRVLSIFKQSSITGVLQVLRFPPVVTLDTWGVALTGPLGKTAYVADRVIQYK